MAGTDMRSISSAMDVDTDEGHASTALSEQVLRNPDILDIIFAFATPATIIRLSWTCRHLLASKDAYFRRAYNANRHLSRFFADPLAFRSLQARTSTLVSGSSALQLLDRSYYAGSDLDTYVPYEHTREVARWLQSAGYAYEPANEVQAADLEAAIVQMQTTTGGTSSIYNMHGVTGVFNFYKRQDGAADDSNARLKVQIIVALLCPMEIILNFHCTCVMNIISHDTAYSLYPRATFESRLALVSATDGKPLAGSLEKYEERGWSLVHSKPDHDLAPQAFREPSFAEGSRWIDDNMTWILPLPTEGIRFPPGYSPDPIALTNWHLVYESTDMRNPRASRDGSKAEVVYQVVCSPLLRQYYVLTDRMLINALRATLKGVSDGLADMREEKAFMSSENDPDGHRISTNPVPQLPLYDGVVSAQCSAHRQLGELGLVPQLVRPRDLPGQFLYL